MLCAPALVRTIFFVSPLASVPLFIVNMAPQLTLEQRGNIRYCRGMGKSLAVIAKEFKCSTGTVRKWCNAPAGPNAVERKPRDVQKVVIGEDAGKRALALLKAGGEGGGKHVAQQLYAEGRVVRVPARSTVVAAAKAAAVEVGDPIRYYRGRPKKGLLPANKLQRLDFCRANLRRDWSNVMFTDRCKFAFRFPGSKVYAGRWGHKSQEDEQGVYAPNNPSVYNVYGGITLHGSTTMYPVTGTLRLKTSYENTKGQKSRNITKAEYKDVVNRGLLPGGAGLFTSGGEPKWVLQQDGDPTHGAAHPVVAKHNASGRLPVQVLPGWPGNSPDLSPIENVWAIVDARVAKLGCKTFSEFTKAVDKAFRDISPGTLKRLFESMAGRMEQCIAKGGAKIRY